MFRGNAKLGEAIMDAVSAGFALQPAAPLRLETLLAAVDRLYPEEVRPFVDDKERFSVDV